MRVAVIGGGSTYTPELIIGFLERHATLPISELWLVDTDPERLEVVGGFARRMVAAHGAPFRVELTGDRRAAIAGASYVITQLRVGRMRARREDEYLGRRHGLVGQETTGVGGFAKALRTVPVILGIADDIRELAPDALLVNFTNPAGLVTEALNRHASDVHAVGVCNGPIHMHMDILEALGRRRGEHLGHGRGALETLGLNHLGWYRGFRLDGVDVWPEVLEVMTAQARESSDALFPAHLIETLGAIPNSYLQYFYDTARKVADQASAPSRAEIVMEIEGGLLREYAEPDRTTPPPGLMERGGAYYSTVATALIDAHHNDRREHHIVNVRHAGAVEGWDPSWVLEMPARVGRMIEPIPASPLPPSLFGLLAQVKAYELLAIDAAVTGSRRAAYEALLAHPLGPAVERIPALLDDLIATNAEHLPRFAGAAA